ncbi:MBOAT family protein, partial [Xanthomonas sp. Kuri4-2]
AWGDAWRALVAPQVQGVYLAALLAIVWLAPNAHQIMGVYSPALARPQPAGRSWLRWQPTLPWLGATLALLALCLLTLHHETRFLYFQF